jgi:hypothetical protein
MKYIYEFLSVRRLAVVVMIAATAGSSARASLIYTLDVDGCGLSCGPPPYGTVTLLALSPHTVKVTVALSSGVVFADSSGEALTFELADAIGAIVIDNLTSGFTIGPAPRMASTFGSFDYSVHCDACTGGNPGNPSGPLSFNVSAASLTPDDFITNGKGYYFATDIRGTTGNTGNVGAINDPIVQDDPVPEPVSIALAGTGLLALWGLRRRLTYCS